ncbi:MAG: phosphate propanoyltransferase [Oscillospiraceae bacterium]|jgi:propanediol utilization protein|nr:phosphate propanoyltransferase [Oscillospiraceae bacterium]
MDQEQLNLIIEKVVATLQKTNADTPILQPPPQNAQTKYAISARPSATGQAIPLEASARHVHLDKATVELLFGKGARLTPCRPLSQPGEFLAQERVKLVTQKGELASVAVLGPEREQTQVELSLTDARVLGLDIPVNLSGDLTGAADVTLVGRCGSVFAKGCVIAAKNHIHMTPSDASRFGVKNGDTVDVHVQTRRPLTFHEVAVRVKGSFALAMHLDFDEANACALKEGDRGTVISITAAPPCKNDCLQTPSPPAAVTDKLLTEEAARRFAQSGAKNLRITKKTIITPSAKDALREAGIIIEHVE